MYSAQHIFLPYSARDDPSVSTLFPSGFKLFSLLSQLSLGFTKGYDSVLFSSFCCLEVMLFPGFYILGKNRISDIFIEAFTCVCPFISKNITELSLAAWPVLIKPQHIRLPSNIYHFVQFWRLMHPKNCAPRENVT